MSAHNASNHINHSNAPHESKSKKFAIKATDESGAGANLAIRGKIPPKPPLVPESSRFRRSEIFCHYSISAKLTILHHAQDCVKRCSVVGSAKCDSNLIPRAKHDISTRTWSCAPHIARRRILKTNTREIKINTREIKISSGSSEK